MLEIPIFGPDDGAAAVLAGAQRLELNRAGSYALGGLTPTIPELAALLASLPASPTRPPIRIMIRPRGAPPTDTGPDFIYTPAELSSMHASIAEFRASGMLDRARGDGFVFGVLSLLPNAMGVGIDVPSCTALVEAAEGMVCVLHRAFDLVLAGVGRANGQEVEEQMGVVRGCGFGGVLTSGGVGNARGNGGVLGRVVEVGRGRGVEVVVGGGVRGGDVRGLVLNGVVGEGVWFHSSCLMGDGEGRRFDVGEVERLVGEIRGVVGS